MFVDREECCAHVSEGLLIHAEECALSAHLDLARDLIKPDLLIIRHL